MAMSDFLMHTYNPQPVSFTHGKGVWLYDKQGNRYLDAVAGIAVCNLGHAHPAVAQAICKQAKTLIHTSNLYHIAAQESLAERLCHLARMERSFFTNSGAEANEAAIKLARLVGHQRGIREPEIIVMEQSFHGRTLATLSATGNRKVQAGFDPLVRGFVRAPFNDLQALHHIAHNRPHVVAVLVEPVQGEGSVRIPDENYLPELRQLCDQQNWLLMVDEIQTGMGRCGRWFAHQLSGIRPDVMTLAKALGNGVPIGACLARGEAADAFAPGNHGTTFGGNPLACHAALTVIDTIESNGLVERAAASGQKLLAGLRKNIAGIDGVKAVRGCGLMLGIELDRPCGELVDRAREQGILINVTANNVIRLLPPLILDDTHIEQIVKTVAGITRTFLAQTAEGKS